MATLQTVVSTSPALIGLDPTIATGADRDIPTDKTVVTVVGSNAPTGATVTLPAVSGKTNACTGISLAYQGATAGITSTGTVSGGSGLVGGNFGFTYVVPTGATIVAEPV